MKKQLLLEIENELCEHEVRFVTQDMQSLLDEMGEGLQRVTRIVKSMTVLSPTNYETLEKFSLNDCVLASCKAFKKQFPEKVDVKLALSDLPDIYINEGKIMQVITNILINAAQAIEYNGHIKVITNKQRNILQVIIIDNGCGIPKFQLSKIFNPFFTTKKQGEGTGLGLAISYEIMQEHGGSIEVSSNINEGTTFILNFPIQQNLLH